MKHKIRPVKRWDEFSQYNEWVCAVCHFRLIRCLGFSVDWIHGFRQVHKN